MIGDGWRWIKALNFDDCFSWLNRNTRLWVDDGAPLSVEEARYYRLLCQFPYWNHPDNVA
jgi:hypothetical protein